MFDEAGLAYPPQKYGENFVLDGQEVDANWDTGPEVAKRLTVDKNGNDSTMEAIDPGIQFYGPDISLFIGNPTAAPTEGDALEYLTEFLKVNGDMVDVVTVHRYPFPACQTCGNPTWQELRENTLKWDNTLPNLRRIIKETTGKDLPVGVTEYNSSYSSAVGAETSPDSFYNALWLANVYGRLISQRPEMLAIWQLTK
jgi:hypothetical protein